ncbi:MAG: hypothetical protein WCW25_03680 [Patescibacteria group bacterium]|jgi:hypothetical protein
MKIGFLLQRRFAVIGQALASNLNQKYGLDKFCGYVLGREGYSYVKERNPLFAGRLLLDEDIHRRYLTEKIDHQFLEKLEKDYGLPGLWPYLEIDRIIRSSQLIRAFPHDTPRFSHEEMLKIIQVTAKAIIEFLDREKPDAMVFSVVGSLPGLLLYKIARKKGIKTLVIHHTRIATRHTLSDNCYNFGYVNDTFKRLNEGIISLPEEQRLAACYLKNLRHNPKPYRDLDSPKYHPVSRRQQFSFIAPKKLLWSVYWRLKMIGRYLVNPNRDDYSNVNPFWELWDNIKIKTRLLLGYGRFFDKISPDDNYAFFPLHREPEIATLLFAPFYKDQLWLIKQIAQSLPINFKLYVKEHAPMLGLRKRSFYRELKKIPNVVLVSPAAESLDLINKARLIYTISGTAGWEAVQLKKPVITFSNIFYTKLPMVKECQSIKDLPRLTFEQLKNFRHDEAALINFLAAIFRESAEVDLTRIWQIETANYIEEEKEELMPLADMIASKLSLEPNK